MTTYHQQEMEDIFEIAEQVYEKYIKEGSKLSALNNDDLKKLVKFVCWLENKPNDSPSHHNNATKMKKRLNECNQPWTRYFMPDDGDDDESSTQGNGNLTQDVHSNIEYEDQDEEEGHDC